MAFGSALVCQRCLHYRTKFGDPRQCEKCLHMCAFYKDEVITTFLFRYPYIMSLSTPISLPG